MCFLKVFEEGDEGGKVGGKVGVIWPFETVSRWVDRRSDGSVWKVMNPLSNEVARDGSELVEMRRRVWTTHVVRIRSKSTPSFAVP